MASSLPLTYDFSVVLKSGTQMHLPSVHPRHLSPAERRCDSCSTIWGEKPHDEDFIEYPFVMIPCQHIVGSACLGLSLKEDKPTCPVCNNRIEVGERVEARTPTTTTTPLSEPLAPIASSKLSTRLDPEWYNNVVPPKPKPANHPHSRSPPISDYTWTVAGVQGAIDVCNSQRNMALDMPYLKTMVAIDNYRKGIHGREPTPWELVQALQELYGYGK